MLNSDLTNHLNKAMTAEQFTQVVDAILEGKYSWACVLILRFAGYNPLHYIPYRTYNRLMKDHCQNSRRKIDEFEPGKPDQASPQLNYQRYTPQIDDLNYLETLNERSSQIRGGQNCRRDAGDRPISHFLDWIRFRSA
ncbi:MAG TPA: HetP family heterocyst commitment protein [Coleofasciculaceae cyanobacterium]